MTSLKMQLNQNSINNLLRKKTELKKYTTQQSLQYYTDIKHIQINAFFTLNRVNHIIRDLKIIESDTL